MDGLTPTSAEGLPAQEARLPRSAEANPDTWPAYQIEKSERLYACTIYVYERYTPVRCMPMRCRPMRCMPMRCTPICAYKVHACEIHAHEIHAYEIHAHEICTCPKMHAHKI